MEQQQYEQKYRRKKDRYTQMNGRRNRTTCCVVCSGYCYLLQYNFCSLYCFILFYFVVVVDWFRWFYHHIEETVMRMLLNGHSQINHYMKHKLDYSGNFVFFYLSINRSMCSCHARLTPPFFEKKNKFTLRHEKRAVCWRVFTNIVMIGLMKRHLQMKAHDHCSYAAVCFY